MNVGWTRGTLRARLLLAGLLAACLVMLVVLNIVTQKISDRKGSGEASLRDIDTAVQSLLLRSRVHPAKIRARPILSLNKEFVRTERKVVAPENFNYLVFVQNLNQAVTRLGAVAVATERMNEDVVTCHIIRNHRIVQTIIVSAEQAESRKEQSY